MVDSNVGEDLLLDPHARLRHLGSEVANSDFALSRFNGYDYILKMGATGPVQFLI
jgi:hypothetical protein